MSLWPTSASFYVFWNVIKSNFILALLVSTPDFRTGDEHGWIQAYWSKHTCLYWFHLSSESDFRNGVFLDIFHCIYNVPDCSSCVCIVNTLAIDLIRWLRWVQHWQIKTFFRRQKPSTDPDSVDERPIGMTFLRPSKWGSLHKMTVTLK